MHCASDRPVACAPPTSSVCNSDLLRFARASRRVRAAGLTLAAITEQIAQMIVARLNDQGLGREKGISRYVALVHTEGCGVTGAQAEALYARSMLSYLTHPLVRCAVLLEHGCEKTHNDYMRNELAERGLAAAAAA